MAQLLFAARRAFSIHVVGWPTVDGGATLAEVILVFLNDLLFGIQDSVWGGGPLDFWTETLVRPLSQRSILSRSLVLVNEISSAVLLRFPSSDNISDLSMRVFEHTDQVFEMHWLTQRGQSSLKTLWLTTSTQLLSNGFDCASYDWPYNIIRQYPRLPPTHGILDFAETIRVAAQFFDDRREARRRHRAMLTLIWILSSRMHLAVHRDVLCLIYDYSCPSSSSA